MIANNAKVNHSLDLEVTSATCSCLALTRTHFEGLLGPLQELMHKKIESSTVVPAKQTPASLGKRPKIDMADLKRLGLLDMVGPGRK